MSTTATVSTNTGESTEVPLLDTPTLIDYAIQQWVYNTLQGHENIVSSFYRKYKNVDQEIEPIPMSEIREAAELIVKSHYELPSEATLNSAVDRFHELLTSCGYTKYSYETSESYTWDSSWNLKELISTLKENKVCRVVAQFNGGGDEGYINQVELVTDDNFWIDFDTTLHRFSWVRDEKHKRGDFLFGPVEFQNALESWAYSIICEEDWWNNEGGYGIFEFYQSKDDPNRWDYNLDINVYYDKSVVGKEGECLITLED